jgi:hypothetical protein
MDSTIKIISLNSTKEPLSIERLKTFKGFEALTDEQAQEIVFEVKKLVNILLGYLHEQEKKISEEEQYKTKPAA